MTGQVWNHARGVTIEVFGASAQLDAFAGALAVDRPPAASVEGILEEQVTSAVAPLAFTIAGSTSSADREVSIPADLATCPDCLDELADPAARRHGYAFTNCTNCGPRFTIALGVPYDRRSTTMARFEMCEACRAEYGSPPDRRFHAQPIACPRCGPRLSLSWP